MYRPPSLTTSLLSLLMLASPAFADTPRAYPDTESRVGFDAVISLPTGTPAAVHSYGPAPSQFAELWLPAGAIEPAPVVVFVHGGCWLSEYSIAHTHALATGLNLAGYAVWNIEYRRVGDPGGGWPGSLDDILAAITLLYQLQPDGVALQRLALAGHSAGGHLALLGRAAWVAFRL